MADVVESLSVTGWTGPASAEEQQRAIDALEAGRLLFAPNLPFTLTEDERRFVSPATVDGTRKNVSFDPATGRIHGTSLIGADAEKLAAMMSRFSDSADSLLRNLAPRYEPHLERGRTSFRPVEVEQRPQTPRHDDRRLHVDAFPTRPMHGRRILRVFANVATDGAARQWAVGEPFTDFARAFLPRLKSPLPGSAALLKTLGMTKTTRSRYDHAMLQLHDIGKLDESYQKNAPRTFVTLPANTSWIVYTDSVLHAALAGHGALEQTFYLPVAAMQHPDQTPLRILERLSGRVLV